MCSEAVAAAANAQVLTFKRQDDGSVTVEQWAPRILITPFLLAYSPLIETTITIRASGQVRRYRVVDVTTSGCLVAEDMGGEDALDG